MSNEKPPLISVVVPVCNVDRFLEQCLISITSQSYEALEIICLNDGSTDNSLEILNMWALKDNRILVVDKENEGYGATCNRGLDMATGSWVSIVEPDDWLEPTMYEDMLRLADRLGGSIDIVKASWLDITQWDDPRTLRKTPSSITNRLETSSRPFRIEENPIFLEIHPSIWSALYRRDFLNSNDIRFIPYPGAGWADNPFLIDTMCRARSIAYLNKPLYNYRNTLPEANKKTKSATAVSVPFDRWITMQEIIEGLGVATDGILAAHYIRGFNYIEDEIRESGWEHPSVQEGALKVLSKMDPRIVSRHPKLSSSRKAFFCEITGATLDDKLLSRERLSYLFGEFALEVKTNGFSKAFERIKRFVDGK